MTAEGASPTRPWFLVLAYVPILGFLPLVLEKRDAEIRWHARNGVLLFAVVVAAALLATLIGIVVPALSCEWFAVIVVGLILYVAVSLLAIVMALSGRRLMIPWISRRASKLSGSR